MWSNKSKTITDEALLETLKEIPKSSITVLDGPSGCGKTRLLKRLRQSGRVIDLYSSEDLKEHIMWRLRHFPNLPGGLPGLDIIVVEDIDFLESAKSVQTEAAFLIERALDEKCVILTGIQIRDRVPTIVDAFIRHNRDLTIWEFTDDTH